MISTLIEVCIEYFDIILCMYRIAGKKLKVDLIYFGVFLLDFVTLILLQNYLHKYGILLGITYVYFLLYARYRIVDRWTDTLRIFGTMFVIISGLQLAMFGCLCIVIQEISNKRVLGILVNAIVGIILLCWNKKNIYKMVIKFKKVSNGLMLLLYFVFFLYLLVVYNKFEVVTGQVMILIMVCTIGLAVVFIWFINAENEKRQHAKELRLYEIYTKAFEEAIMAIRMKQHEFNNHINAIRCMNYTIHNTNELIEAQNRYCNEILEDNSVAKILRLNTSPVLCGFLYSKYVCAKDMKIEVVYEIAHDGIDKKVAICDLIEIIGILFDNAVEAIKENKLEKRRIVINIVADKQNNLVVSIQNTSIQYTNSEIENFFKYGYSSKGTNRGVGLARVKELSRKYKAKLSANNVEIESCNYLSFELVFATDRKRD